MQLNKLAFTLIELLVVIAIIGILSGLIVVSMSGVTQKADIAKAQVFSNSIRNSLMLNLVSEWKLDQINVPSSNQTPDSWGVNNGTVNVATIINSGCFADSCLSVVGGTAGYVTIPDSSTLDAVWNENHIFTLEAWIYNTLYVNYQGIINKRTSGHYSATPGGLFIDNNGITLAFIIGTGLESSNSSRSNYSIANLQDKWIHVVGTADGSNLRLYVNGKLVDGPDPFTQNPPTNDEPMTIGAFYAGVRAFSGKIDNVRIYSTNISASKIKEQYFSGLKQLFISGGIDKEEYLSRYNEIALGN